MRILPRNQAATEVRSMLKDYGPLTATQMVERCDIKSNTLRHNVDRLHAAGELHVAGWTEPQRSCQASAIFALGAGQDAPKPPKKPKTRTPKVTKAQEAEKWVRTEGLQMVYPIKSVFAGGVNPWTGA